MSGLGFIVDSSEEFVGLDDVIRIKQVHEYNFQIIGLSVIDEQSKKLGKVEGFNVDSGSFSIQQIVVKRPLLKSFGEAELLIHRTQILEVSNSHVKVETGSAKETSSPKNLVREYANPFRTGNVQPEAIDTEPRWP